jgi:hypothetical protein
LKIHTREHLATKSQLGLENDGGTDGMQDMAGTMKCYYCNNIGIHIKTYTDDVDGISYEYEHCQEHADIDDHSQYALDLWKLHQEDQDKAL